MQPDADRVVMTSKAPIILRAAVQINVTCNECEKKFRKDKEVEAASLGLPTL